MRRSVRKRAALTALSLALMPSAAMAQSGASGEPVVTGNFPTGAWVLHCGPYHESYGIEGFRGVVVFNPGTRAIDCGHFAFLP